MKALFTTSHRKTIAMMMAGGVLLVANLNVAMAQLPDCSSGNVMYGIFNDSTGSGTNAPSEIRSINYVTGAVGPIMGGAFTIKKGGFYGSAALAIDPTTKRFYVNTQMGGGSGTQKDIISWDPLTSTQVAIGTTPNGPTVNVPVLANGLDDYHFVKLAISPGGLGYAIGVSRDTTVTTPATCNPLISFTTCGVLPLAGCSVIKLLGFLPTTAGLMNNWELFNGDIAFNAAGDLYFATAAFGRVAGANRYTNARLFKIAAANIPSVPGNGIIPMSLVANYVSLDSTVLNGIAFDPLGKMYFATRRFLGPQNTSPKYVNEVYRSTVPGSATIIPGFSVPTPGYSIADLGSCYFPLGVLAQKELALKSNFTSGVVNLKWQVNNNDEVIYFEVQRSDDEYNFETIAKIEPQNVEHISASYSYADPQKGSEKNKFYRVSEITKTEMRFYSNVEKVTVNNKLNVISNPKPNPFINSFEFNVQLRSANNINLKMSDQTGRMVYQRRLAGQTGINNLRIDGLYALQPGIYTVEIAVESEVVREKLIKQ